MRNKWIWGLAGATLAVVVGAPTAAAQVVLTGTVLNDSSRAPLAGVEIAIEAAGGAKTVTDADGAFTLVGLPLGIGTAIIRKVGFRPVRLRTYAFGDDTVTIAVRLKPAVVELEPLEVRASSMPRGMQEFAERRFSGLGTYLDPETLRKSEHRRLSDLLRGVRGVQLRPASGNRYVAVSSRGSCPMAVWLDGVEIYRPGVRGSAPDIDMLTVATLGAVEIYRGGADTPAELGGSGASCGTIVLWTRRG